MRLTSPDFTLYSRGTREDLESFAVDLARYIAVVERLVQAEPPKTSAHLVLVDERAEALFVPIPWQAAYIGNTLGGFNGFVRGGTHDPTLRSVLLHEYTHYLTGRNTRLRYPTWYEEGFAEFLGPIRSRGDTMEIGSRPPWRLDALEKRQVRKEAIDLTEIFAFKRGAGEPYPRDFYSISWATVHYLNSSPERQKQLVAMVEGQASGLDWNDAYSIAFDQPIEELSKKVSLHVNLLNRGATAALLYLPLDILEVRTSWEIHNLPPAEAVRFLAEFAAHGVISHSAVYKSYLAEMLFERALELTPKDSRVHAGLASVLAEQERFDEASRHLAVFEEDPNPSTNALIYAGLAVQKQAEATGKNETSKETTRLHMSAISRYRTALDSEPENPFALAGLGRGLLAIEDFDQARDSLASAQSFGEWDAELTLDRGRVEKETGFSDRAQAFWKEVIHLGTEKQAKEATALIALEKINAPREQPQIPVAN